MSTVTVWVLIGVAVANNAVSWWRERQRSSVLRQIASKFGFVPLGKMLPRSVNLTETGLERMSACWNVMDGDLDGVRVLVFDCRIGNGKGSWRRTVIAAKSNTEIFKGAPYVLDLSVESAGEWALLYQPKTYRIIPPGLMSASELESLLERFNSHEV